MKKILFFLLLISSAASAQLRFTNNRAWNLNRFRLSIDSGNFRIPRFTTAALPAGTAGDFLYNVDSNKIFFYNGSGWVNPANTGGTAYTASNGLTLSGVDFKLGGTLSANTAINNTNTYTWQIDNAGTARLHVKANGNVVVGGTSDGGGYNFAVNGIGGLFSGGNYFVFNGTDIQYNGGTGAAVMKIFGGTGTKRWDWTVNNSGMTIAPQTDNTLPFLITDNASVTRFRVDFSTAKTTIASPLKLSGIWGNTPTRLLGTVVSSGDTMVTSVDANASLFQSAPYTPSFNYVTNVSATSTAALIYQQVGDIVHVFGTITIIPTTAAAVELDFSFPVASAITLASQVSGTGACSAFPAEVLEISGDATNDRVVCKTTPSTTATRTYYIHLSYKYIAP
jgi:hypothetical protein